MNSRVALSLFFSGCIALYIIEAVLITFVAWDFSYLWVGNWDGFGRVIYAVGVFLIAGSLIDQWNKEKQ